MSANQPIAYVDLAIGGMTCDDCVHAVTRALESVPGVVSAVVSLSERRAEVAARPDVAADALTAAVRASGYHAFVRRQGAGPLERRGAV